MKTLESWIKHHEGFRAFPYTCTGGKLTIGYGWNIEDTGITREEAEFILNNRILRCKQELAPFGWYIAQPPGVKDALINMCYNIGLPRLLKFKRMITALEREDYTKAALEALDSKWAKQVHDRAKDIALMIREGK